MEKIFRIIDANINRASEGLRVLEDLARFYYDDETLSKQIKKVRHGIRDHIMEHIDMCLECRNSLNDVGLSVSKQLKVDDKSSISQIIAANFKRAQEALRVIEENLKLIDEYEKSKIYEEYRFLCYQIERDYKRLLTINKKSSVLDTDLYCITAEEYSNGRSNIEVVESMISAGVKVIQYREKDKKQGEKYNECIKIRDLTKKAGVTFIVNDDVEIAKLVNADGVHIGQDDLPIEKVRKIVGDKMIIGLSTHSPKQAHNAVVRGADYIGVGPIFKTFTKKDVCEPVGLEYLEYVVKNVDIPFVAIGGIKQHNMHEVIQKGAKCIAMVTEIVGAKEIEAKIKSIKQAMDEKVFSDGLQQ